MNKKKLKIPITEKNSENCRLINNCNLCFAVNPRMNPVLIYIRTRYVYIYKPIIDI